MVSREIPRDGASPEQGTGDGSPDRVIEWVVTPMGCSIVVTGVHGERLKRHNVTRLSFN